MPNNPARNRKGYEATLSGQRRMKRRDVASSIRVVNKVFAAAGAELGSPNGGPAPTFSGGSSGGSGSGGSVLA